MTAIFGIDYGGASCAIVHQDRLVLAGGGAVPDVLAASKTGAWLTFATFGTDEDGNALDATAADGFWFQQTTARGNRFHALLQQQGLLLFGDVGESAIPPAAFTAAEVEIRENSSIGSDTGRPPIIAGNLVVFLQRGGQDLRGIAWNEQQLKYLVPSLMVLSGNVFERGRDLTYQPSSGRRGDTVYVIDEDGRMAVCLIRVGEDTPAWSRWETEGRVVGAAAPLGQPVFLVARGPRRDQYAIETLGETGPTDCEVELTSDGLPEWMRGLAGGSDNPLRARIFEGETFLNDHPEEVFTIGNDGQPSPELTVPDGQTLRIGLRYERILETVQFVRRTQAGTNARMTPMRILECVVDFVLPKDHLVYRTAPEEQREARARLRREQRDLIRRCAVQVIPTVQGRTRPRKVRGQPPPPLDQNEDITSIRYPARVGWLDRVAVELRSEDHMEVAGVAYRASA